MRTVLPPTRDFLSLSCADRSTRLRHEIQEYDVMSEMMSRSTNTIHTVGVDPWSVSTQDSFREMNEWIKWNSWN